MAADLAMKYELANIFKTCGKLDTQMLVPPISFTNMKMIRKCSDSNMKSQRYVHIALGANP